MAGCIFKCWKLQKQSRMNSYLWSFLECPVLNLAQFLSEKASYCWSACMATENQVSNVVEMRICHSIVSIN